MAKKFNREKLDKAAKVFVDDNVKKGFPHFNCVDWVMQAYPQFARDIQKAMDEMRSTAVEAGDELHFTDEAIEAFLRAWKRPCAEIRRRHEQGYPKITRLKDAL